MKTLNQTKMYTKIEFFAFDLHELLHFVIYEWNFYFVMFMNLITV